MTRVLIAVDETEESIHAAEVAHGLFGDGAEYLAMSVADMRIDPALMPWWGVGWGVAYPVPYGYVWSHRVDQTSRLAVSPRVEVTPEQMAIDAAVDDARAAADESGLPGAEPVGDLGDAAEAIMRVAEERAVDVIVLGTHERGWFDRLLHPSVSSHVFKHTAIPVLVVK